MKITLDGYIKQNQTVAVALSGGSDSMALLYYMREIAEKYPFKLIAINVEHGIRGDASKKDTEFVQNVCKKLGVELLCYSVDCTSYAKERKLSTEEAARILRYECFFDAISKGNCDKVATAHHNRDNAESVLFNVFRGTGLKGLAGISVDRSSKIIRPFIKVSKEEIENYVTENKIPFVTDESNFSDEYTRNYIRLKILPEIKRIFPDVENSISRLSEIAKDEDEFLDKLADENLIFSDGYAQISVNLDKVIFNRAVIIAVKRLGIEKDWQKTHVDAVYKLRELKSGSRIILPKHFTAFKEYDKIILTRKSVADDIAEIPFTVGQFSFCGNRLAVEFTDRPKNLKDGLYIDFDKIPSGAVIRTKKPSDSFTKFGGGTKKLNDYLTDIKIPLRLRNTLPVIAVGNIVFAIFGVAVSEKVKVDSSTENIIKITKEENNE